jgi:UDP-3-O-[3-hydroxymyristoyl] glucosamine N-acyltransferase
METEVRSWTLGELAKLLAGELDGSPDVLISGVAQAGAGTSSDITFAEDQKHISLADRSDVGAVILGLESTSDKPHIHVEKPREAFETFLTIFGRGLPLAKGIHPTAVVSPNSEIDPSASIGPYAVVEAGAKVGRDCRIFPFCYVGEGCDLHESVVLYPHVVLYQDVVIGARSVIHSGTVLGADGFGYEWDGSRHRKIPQVGKVRIGSDCEIGALSAVDRAMIGQTALGEDTKLDNLVQIGHNVVIGDHTVIAAQTGIGGSCVIGNGVFMGGQVGLSDHVSVGDGVSIAARSASTRDVMEPGLYHGHPMVKIEASHRITANIQRLPELAKLVKDLKRRLDELESRAE